MDLSGPDRYHGSAEDEDGTQTWLLAFAAVGSSSRGRALVARGPQLMFRVSEQSSCSTGRPQHSPRSSKSPSLR